MSERRINLEEILDKHFHLYTAYSVRNKEGKFISVIDKKGAIEAMKEACIQALELAAINIKLDAIETYGTDIPDCWNIDSITNTINQIE